MQYIIFLLCIFQKLAAPQVIASFAFLRAGVPGRSEGGSVRSGVFFQTDQVNTAASWRELMEPAAERWSAADKLRPHGSVRETRRLYTTAWKAPLKNRTQLCWLLQTFPCLFYTLLFVIPVNIHRPFFSRVHLTPLEILS